MRSRLSRAIRALVTRFAHGVAHAQVEQNMQLCISVTARLEKMVTIPGSEPLLTEAAYQLMEGRAHWQGWTRCAVRQCILA
jgi:hypothetical protein